MIILDLTTNYYGFHVIGMWEPVVAALLDEIQSLRKHRTIVYVAR